MTPGRRPPADLASGGAGWVRFPSDASAASSARPRLVALVLGMVAVVVLAYAAVSLYMAFSLTGPERREFTSTPAQFGLAWDEVGFPSRIDNLHLTGWLMPGAPGVPARRPVVVVHGKGGDRENRMDGHSGLEVAAALVGRGHPVLVFDLRASGRSEGQRFTLGAKEVRDVGGAVDFLRARGLADRGVDLLGFSMGAATALLYAPTDAAVRAVVADSSYADLGDVLEGEGPRESGLPRLFTPGFVWAASLLVGANPRDIRPIDGVPALAARGTPLFVVQGEADELVPVEHGHRIAAAYGPAAETWFPRGVEHTRAYVTDPNLYLARVTDFLARAE